MKTQFSRAFMVTSALILSLLTTGVIPATTAHAASKGAEHRSAVAAAHSKAPIRTTTEEPNIAPTTNAPAKQMPGTAVESEAKVSATDRAYTKPAHSPAGNNGFIKVNEEVIPDSIPNNDPHVSCQFKVEFYNYDVNPAHRANVSFALHNPTAGDGYSLKTSGNVTPVIGGDAAGGGNDLDAVETYKLSFTGQPHAKQGYHVKLTIRADGSRGADVKHKVFWVQPCEGQVLGSSGGQILATSTTKEAGAVLPSTLPSTGTNVYGFVVTLLASALAYVIAFGTQKLRSFQAQA
jgi:hypothetical protein